MRATGHKVKAGATEHAGPGYWLLEKTIRNNILTLITVLLLSLAGTEVSASGVPVNAESKGGYAPIHGMQLYYEIHGQGKPMVLLHGGITAFEGFGTNIDAERG